MFPMTLTLHNTAQLNAVMAAMHAASAEPTTAELVQIAKDRAEAQKDAAAPAGKSAKAATPAPSPRTATVEAAAAPEQSTAQQERPASTETAATASSAADPVTYDQVAKAITEAAKADRAKVVDTLAKFGAKKGTELKAEQYADFLAALG